MSDERAGIFDSVVDFDIGGFAPKQPKKAETAPAPTAEKVRAIAEASQFPSREAGTKAPKATVASVTKAVEEIKKEPRRHKTGRNVQLNLKVKQETLDLIYKISDENGWVLGETLERALEALQKGQKSQL